MEAARNGGTRLWFAVALTGPMHLGGRGLGGSHGHPKVFDTIDEQNMLKDVE